MQRPIPLTNDIVLVGGGHAHALVLRSWGMRPVAGARLTLINPAPTAPYTGMLPGHIAGHYPRDALEIDLVRLARFAGARFLCAKVTGLDREARRVRIHGRPDVAYDVVSLDVGITSDMPNLPGFADHGVAAKPLGPYANRWAAYCEDVAAGRVAPQIVVIGAGVAGVELALAMDHRLCALGFSPTVRLVDRGPALAHVSGNTRAILFDRLYRAGITVLEHTEIARVTARAVDLVDGRSLPATLTVGAAGARPHPWVAELGLPHVRGYLTVEECLRSPEDGRVFGAGDCVHLSHAPRPKAGVYAVRAAPVLESNLRAAVMGTARRAFRPQGDFLKLISLGARDAVGERLGLSLAGPWLWRQKDRIDRAFMDRLAKLPTMAPPPLPHPRTRDLGRALSGPPPCAGCGAKVGADALSQTLRGLPRLSRPDVVTGHGDDAAVLEMGGVRQVISTDHLRGFVEDPGQVARIAAIHAMGDVWAMGARPQVALASLVLPHMAPRMQRETLREVMETAAAVFAAEGVEIVGGHSALGAELTVGFTVTGLGGARSIGLAGAQAGDALILTKPLGTGILLAGDMAGRTAGPDLMAALDMMGRSQGRAVEALAAAHAMTDVTGFGLAGHLMGMCHASGVGAWVNLSALPLYDGVERLAERGVASTLAPANRAALGGLIDAPQTPRAATLFDPQTAGGLLAALPADGAREALAKLHREGFPATIIGHVTDDPPGLVAL